MINTVGNFTFNKTPLLDTSKPYRKEIRAASRSSGEGGMSSMLNFNSNPLSVIVDTYSGKYYGESSQKEFTDYYSSQLRGIKSNMEYLSQHGAERPVTNPQPSMGSLNIMLPLTAAQKATRLADYASRITSTESELAKFTNSYEQRPQMLGSYQAHPDGWAKYFESSYKNPRQAEANASQVQMQSNGQSPLAIASPAQATPKTVGTGIASTSSINPFGRLDAGLGV